MPELKLSDSAGKSLMEIQAENLLAQDPPRAVTQRSARLRPRTAGRLSDGQIELVQSIVRAENEYSVIHNENEVSNAFVMCSGFVYDCHPFAGVVALTFVGSASEHSRREDQIYIALTAGVSHSWLWPADSQTDVRTVCSCTGVSVGTGNEFIVSSISTHPAQGFLSCSFHPNSVSLRVLTELFQNQIAIIAFIPIDSHTVQMIDRNYMYGQHRNLKKTSIELHEVWVLGSGRSVPPK